MPRVLWLGDLVKKDELLKFGWFIFCSICSITLHSLKLAAQGMIVRLVSFGAGLFLKCELLVSGRVCMLFLYPLFFCWISVSNTEFSNSEDTPLASGFLVVSRQVHHPWQYINGFQRTYIIIYIYIMYSIYNDIHPPIASVYPPTQDSSHKRWCFLGFPTKHEIILVVTGILGG